MAKTKLELTWIGKENRPRLEPRILLEDPELSYAAKRRVSEDDIFDNIVVEGDNLLALKAIEQQYAQQIKLIYIDPPYNANATGVPYDDLVEHSIWLGLMRERLEILWRLLSPSNGTLLISINDDEAHYLKVLCDEIFGRGSFVATLVWNYEGNTDNQAKIIRYHEYILVYSTTGQVDNPQVIDPNVGTDSKLYRPEIRNTIIKNGPKNPPNTVKIPPGLPATFASGIIRARDVQFPQYNTDIVVRNGRTVNEVLATTGWSSKKIFESFIEAGFRPVTDTKGQSTTFELTSTGAIEAVKVREQEKGHFLSVLRGFGTTNQMRLLLEKIGVKFAYPKPTRLISYLVGAFSGPDDLVLDSFAGSGTTGHSVLLANREYTGRRKFILVELSSETMRDVTLPRLRAAIGGHEGAALEPLGGGFRFYRLAPSLLERDKWGNWVINRSYNKEMLAEAMCKLHGFTYAPSDSVFWMHGQSTEQDYIYVTTQTLTFEQLQAISEEVGNERTLLVCCGAWLGKVDSLSNLTVVKIPQSVLERCEWGKDDYSLNVANLMGEDPEPTAPAPAP